LEGAGENLAGDMLLLGVDGASIICTLSSKEILRLDLWVGRAVPTFPGASLPDFLPAKHPAVTFGTGGFGDAGGSLLTAGLGGGRPLTTGPPGAGTAFKTGWPTMDEWWGYGWPKPGTMLLQCSLGLVTGDT